MTSRDPVTSIHLRAILATVNSLGRSVGVGGASTYMSVDVERISEGLEYIHEFWAGVVRAKQSVKVLEYYADV